MLKYINKILDININIRLKKIQFIVNKQGT